MDARTKEFNRYLDDVRINNALTGCFARLFMFTDLDRPDHGIWFLQNCVNSKIEPDFIVNYDKLLNELATNKKFIKKAQKAEEKAQQELQREAAKAAAKAKKEADDAAAKAVSAQPDANSQQTGQQTGQQTAQQTAQQTGQQTEQQTGQQTGQQTQASNTNTVI